MEPDPLTLSLAMSIRLILGTKDVTMGSRRRQEEAAANPLLRKTVLFAARPSFGGVFFSQIFHDETPHPKSTQKERFVVS